MEGLDRIATRRAEELGDRILLNTRVDLIEWSRKKVRIHAFSPNGESSQEGVAAVVTVPLGVLKAGDVIFDPPLPDEKQRSIDTLGYGDVTKVILCFDAAVRRTVLGKSVFLAHEDSGFFFLPFYGIKQAPVVVEGFLAGRRARELFDRPEEDVVRETIKMLAQMMPTLDLNSRLQRAWVVDWKLDSFSRGAYSFPSMAGGLDARRRLAAPVDDTLFFAGEATNYDGEHATIHGALDSGGRAAREVLIAHRAR